MLHGRVLEKLGRAEDAVRAHETARRLRPEDVGTVLAMMEAGHPMVPIAAEAENGVRKLIAQHAKEGLKGYSYGQSPGLVAISMKAAISALEGNVMPQLISVPIPEADYTNLKDGVNFWSNLPDSFFTPNDFPPCGVSLSAPEIMGYTAENVK